MFLTDRLTGPAIDNLQNMLYDKALTIKEDVSRQKKYYPYYAPNMNMGAERKILTLLKKFCIFETFWDS